MGREREGEGEGEGVMWVYTHKVLSLYTFDTLLPSSSGAPTAS